MPALEPLRGLRVVADPAALDARALAPGRRRHGPPPRPGRRLRDRRAPASTSTTRTPSSRTRPASSAPGCRSRTHRAITSNGRCPTERPALAQGSIAGVPAKLWLADDGDALLVTRAAYADELASALGGAMSEYTDTLLADPLAATRRSQPTTSSSSAAAATACRPRTTSRPATASRTSPSSRPTTSRRATPAATRRSSAPTTASPRRSASTSTRSSCTRRLEDETGAAILHQTKGILWLAHTEMAMRTERARCLMNHGLRRQDRACVTPAELKDARPAARPDRRRPLPGPGRVAPRRGRDGPPRPGRLGVRARRVAARRRPPPAHAGHRPAAATATRVVGVETPAGPIAAGVVLSRGRRAGDRDRRAWPASGCPSARIRSTPS